MHDYLRRMNRAMQRQWAPLVRGHVVKTAITHKEGCALAAQTGECACAPDIIVTTRDGRRFALDDDGQAQELS
jgi:hypothetical protein